jgi:hypothetical protein
MLFYTDIINNEKKETCLVLNRSQTGLMIEQFAILENCGNTDKYTQLSLYSFRNGKIHLSRFPNVKTLYLYSPSNLELVNIPDSLETIFIRIPGQNLKIPYKDTIKNVVNGSAMREAFIDFSKVYHKYKLHHFDYTKAVTEITDIIMENPDEDRDALTERIVIDLTNQ